MRHLLVTIYFVKTDKTDQYPPAGLPCCSPDRLPLNLHTYDLPCIALLLDCTALANA